MATSTTKTGAGAKAKAVPAEAVASAAAENAKEIIVRDIDPHTLVSVRNGFQGRLVYVSKRTGETYVWEEFGDELEMELQELKNVKSGSKRFFADNWFMFDDDWVIDYLGVRAMYKNALQLDEFDDLFAESPEIIESEIEKLSDGQKASLGYRARQLIAEGQIDSRKAILALEKALGTELTEH